MEGTQPETQRFSARWDAPDGTVFAPGAFGSSPGTAIKVNSGGASCAGKVIAAEISGDGTYVTVTYEVPAGAVALPMPRAGLSIKRT
jgi:hypothetical protein